MIHQAGVIVANPGQPQFSERRTPLVNLASVEDFSNWGKRGRMGLVGILRCPGLPGSSSGEPTGNRVAIQHQKRSFSGVFVCVRFPKFPIQFDPMGPRDELRSILGKQEAKVHSKTDSLAFDVDRGRGGTGKGAPLACGFAGSFW